MKRGGGGVKKGDDSGAAEFRLQDGVLSPDCEFLSVEMVEPLVETPSLGQDSSSFSTTASSSFSSLVSVVLLNFKIGDEDSSCSLKKSSLEDLASVFQLLRSLDKGRPFFTVSMAWKASNLLILLARPPPLLVFDLGV